MILGILLRYADQKLGGHWDHIYKMQHDFQLMAEQYGITLCAIINPCDAQKLCDVCDGLIIPGSNNGLNPVYYGGEPPAVPDPVDEYAHDSQVIDLFVKAGKPVFGVCQGLQALNIYFGGTIHRVNAAGTHCLPGEDARQQHSISIRKGSFVHDVFGTDHAVVNSHHNWGIDRLAEGLTIAAMSEDGVIEAVENRERRIFATQWHPEQHFHGDDPIEQNFFRNFLDLCKK